MIKFFRKIRQNLLTENKFSKYMLYVIGEIILVVIGILIALQLNTWKEERQAEKEELKILKSVYNEMTENLAQFDSGYSSHIKKLKSIKTILFSNLKEFNISQFDSIGSNYLNSTTYNPSFSIYNTLVSSGKIELISKDSLKYKISNYKDIVADFTEGELVARKNTRDHNWTYFVNSGISAKNRFGLSTRNEKELESDLQHYLNEYESPQFQNAMAILLLNMNEIISDGKNLRTKILSLIEMLENEIKNFKE